MTEKIHKGKASYKRIKTNIENSMIDNNILNYDDFLKYSHTDKRGFWTYTVQKLNIVFDKLYKDILNLDSGAHDAKWLHGSSLNIAKSCFNADKDDIALIYENKHKQIEQMSYEDLRVKCLQFANSLKKQGIFPGDRVAIDMPMNPESVIAYLGVILYGAVAVNIADSFSSEEIKTRLNITDVKLVITQDIVNRSRKKIELYSKVKGAGQYPCVVYCNEDENSKLQAEDISWQEFLISDFEDITHYGPPEKEMTILFSSGTTGNPKAIPWNHCTPIKSASDAYYHHDVQSKDVVCWPTNLGWMMGPWLVFATLINKGTIALYDNSALDSRFGHFIENAKVNILGLVPSIVSSWLQNGTMSQFSWQHLKCFSSSGECSNPNQMKELMEQFDNKPIIEYCGGTETGGGYISSTLIQPNLPSLFSSPTLGGNFAILNDEGELSQRGEVFLIPPIMGLSNKLINGDHFKVYYKDCPKVDGLILRRHGDNLIQHTNGYYQIQGRSDDAMNLGGIKVSSTQIEELITEISYVNEAAAIELSDKRGGPSKLVICYVGDKNTNDLIDMQNLIKNKLNPLFKVSSCYNLDKLPRTASNKIMRRKLREYYQQQQ